MRSYSSSIQRTTYSSSIQRDIWVDLWVIVTSVKSEQAIYLLDLHKTSSKALFFHLVSLKTYHFMRWTLVLCGWDHFPFGNPFACWKNRTHASCSTDLSPIHHTKRIWLLTLQDIRNLWHHAITEPMKEKKHVFRIECLIDIEQLKWLITNWHVFVHICRSRREKKNDIQSKISSLFFRLLSWISCTNNGRGKNDDSLCYVLEHASYTAQLNSRASVHPIVVERVLLMPWHRWEMAHTDAIKT